MEQYKEKLKISLFTYTVSALLLAIAGLLSFLSEQGLLSLGPIGGDSHWQSLWRGFISGASCALLLFMVYGIARGLRALKDEKALKKLYVQQHDERSIQIWTSARAVAYQIFLILGIVAVVVTGYFNMTVSLTILGCIWFASVLGLALKIYYNKKF